MTDNDAITTIIDLTRTGVLVWQERLTPLGFSDRDKRYGCESNGIEVWLHVPFNADTGKPFLGIAPKGVVMGPQVSRIHDVDHAVVFAVEAQVANRDRLLRMAMLSQATLALAKPKRPTLWARVKALFGVFGVGP